MATMTTGPKLSNVVSHSEWIDARKEFLAKANEVLRFHEELLAEAEHDGWMDWHFDNGWSQSKDRNDACQLHNRLVPYTDLPDNEKAKDKDAISHYPDIAELAGLKIVSSGEG